MSTMRRAELQDGLSSTSSGSGSVFMGIKPRRIVGGRFADRTLGFRNNPSGAKIFAITHLQL